MKSQYTYNTTITVNKLVVQSKPYNGLHWKNVALPFKIEDFDKAIEFANKLKNDEKKEKYPMRIRLQHIYEETIHLVDDI